VSMCSLSFPATFVLTAKSGGEGRGGVIVSYSLCCTGRGVPTRACAVGVGFCAAGVSVEWIPPRGLWRRRARAWKRALRECGKVVCGCGINWFCRGNVGHMSVVRRSYVGRTSVICRSYVGRTSVKLCSRVIGSRQDERIDGDDNYPDDPSYVGCTSVKFYGMSARRMGAQLKRQSYVGRTSVICRSYVGQIVLARHWKLTG